MSMLMPPTPRCPLYPPIPAQARPEPLGAAIHCERSASQQTAPVCAYLPQIARCCVGVGMGAQAPPQGAYLLLKGRRGFYSLSETLPKAPRQAFVTFFCRHECPPYQKTRVSPCRTPVAAGPGVVRGSAPSLQVIPLGQPLCLGKQDLQLLVALGREL